MQSPYFSLLKASKSTYISFRIMFEPSKIAVLKTLSGNGPNQHRYILYGGGVCCLLSMLPDYRLYDGLKYHTFGLWCSAGGVYTTARSLLLWNLSVHMQRVAPTISYLTCAKGAPCNVIVDMCKGCPLQCPYLACANSWPYNVILDTCKRSPIQCRT